MRSMLLATTIPLIASVFVPVSLAEKPMLTTFPTDAEIREILQHAIDVDKRSAGIVVGLVTEAGTRVISHGSAGDGATRPLDGDTIFEIGSITKTFTGTLLTDMIRTGDVAPEDAITKFLPKKVGPPRRKGKDITLRDLATHSSGLMRDPSNLPMSNPRNPFGDYTVELLYDFLGETDVQSDIGSAIAYSNVGYGLLGHCLELKSGKSYEELVAARILKPLGMSSTGINLSDDQKSCAAVGHDATFKAYPMWDLGCLQGCGALRSSVNDMLKYVAANAGLTDSPLSLTFAKAQAFDIPVGEQKCSLAWGEPTDLHDTRIIWHNGGTGGYHSFAGWDPATKRGVVVLSNCTIGTDDIGFHLLQPKYPLRRNGVAIKLPSEKLDRYVGVYEISNGVFREVTRFRDRMFIQRTGQPQREVFAENENGFFDKEVGIRLSFDTDSSGKVTGMLLFQPDGTPSPAKRVDRPLSQKRKAIETVDPTTYDGLVGKYRLGPEHLFTVTRDGDRLMVELSSQPTFEVFPEAENKFFYTVVDAQLTFERDKDGRATKLILHQHGMNQPAERIQE